MLAFIDRPPTEKEAERIRLLLSTYQDGTGMNAIKGGGTLPGWRDFERSVAFALGGTASESKQLFDVVLDRHSGPDTPRYGLSCKMRSELNRIDRDGRVTVEVSNSLGKFWDHLHIKGITQATYRGEPREVGESIVELVHSWEAAEGLVRNIDVTRSCYLVLSWNRSGLYQLHQFPLRLFDPKEITWHFPEVVRGGVRGDARRLIGADASGTLIEWYGESGGQLKYYPFEKDATWRSERFRLEPLPDAIHGVIHKAAAYYPRLWARVCEEIRER